MKTNSVSTELSTYKDRKLAIREALPQILAVSAKNVLVLAFGTSIGYTTILIPSLSSNNPDEIFHLNDNQISWIGSIGILFFPIGSLLSGFITQSLGRKQFMMVINLPLMVSWIIIHLSTQVWHIYVALCVGGFCAGMLIAPILTYIAEVTQPRLRGILTATSTCSMMLGICLAMMLGAYSNWRTIAIVCSALPILSFILLLFVPESPHWLIMNGRMQKARQNLAWLRGWCAVEDIEVEFQEILVHINSNSSTKTQYYGSTSKNQETYEDLTSFSKITKYYLRRSFLFPLFILCVCFFIPHFTGSFTLQTYAVKIFGTFEIPLNKYYATIALGWAEFFGCVINTFMVHFTGKRLLGLISIISSGVCAIVVACYAQINGVYYLSDVQNSTYVTEISNLEVDNYKWIPFVFLILLAFSSYCGIANLAWILIAEVFSENTRSVGCGIASTICFISGFVTNKIFLKIVDLFTIPGTYCFYGSISFLGAIILYFILPETEGKTLEEISDHFAGISKLDNKVGRRNPNIQEQTKHNGAYERI